MTVLLLMGKKPRGGIINNSPEQEVRNTFALIVIVFIIAIAIKVFKEAGL